jgi:hypothetical protein
VVSEYLGSGRMAEVAALIDQLERAERIQARLEWKAERDAIEAEDDERAGFFEATGLVVRLMLESAGFKQHKRGEWRLTRVSDDQALYTQSGKPKAKLPVRRDEVIDVFSRASKGDQTALPRLREIVAMDPATMIRVAGGELADQVETAMIQKLVVDNLTGATAIELKMEAIRSELAPPDAPPLERLLAERVAICWLDVHSWDLWHARAGGISLEKADHFQRMRDRTHRRYMSALKALATVRKLNVVAVQVNIDRQQINVGEV